jgi:hypothetical protein
VDARASVAQLIERFHQERDYLKAASTKEHLIRKAYIDPLFSALQRIAMTLTRVHVTDARLLAVARP